MLDHMTFRVRDIARTRAFYSAALAPLGYALTFDQVFEGQAVLGFSHLDATEPEGQRADVWFMDGDSPYGQAPATTLSFVLARTEPGAGRRFSCRRLGRWRT